MFMYEKGTINLTTLKDKEYEFVRPDHKSTESNLYTRQGSAVQCTLNGQGKVYLLLHAYDSSLLHGKQKVFGLRETGGRI